MADLWLEEKKPKKRATFKLSERLEEISKPTKVVKPRTKSTKFRIKRAALRYKCTPRIDNLAIPLERQHLKPKLKGPEATISSYFKIPKKALRAKLTARIEQLAQPRNPNNKPYVEMIQLKEFAENEVQLAGSKAANKRIGPAKKGGARKCSKSSEVQSQDDFLSINEKKHQTNESTKPRKFKNQVSASLGLK